MHPKESLAPAQFHDWYNNDHGPTRLRLPWCLNGFRYRANDGDYSATKPEFMAVYDIDDMDWLTKDVYTRLRKAPVQSQRERDTMKQITVDRRFYDFIKEWKGDEYKKLENIENFREGNVVVAVSFQLQEGADEAELTRWYDDEHVALLQAVPGWRRSRRFVTSYLDIQEGKPKEFLALHEYAPQNGLGGPEMQKATSTDFSKKIYADVVKDRKRRVYGLYYTFGPAPRDLTALSDPAVTQEAEFAEGGTRTFPAAVSETKTPAIESWITTKDGVQLPYRLEGSSDPDAPLLVCINSILVDFRIWDDFVPAFLKLTNNKYRVIRYNTRGRSSLPSSSTSPVTIDTLTSDVITIIDAVKAKTASLIGVSLGGATALNTALQHPDRITAFISCDTNSVAPPGNPKAWGERIDISEKESLTAASGEKLVGEELAEVTARRWFVKESYENPSLAPKLEEVKQFVKSNSLDGFKKSVNALYQYDFRPQMKEYSGKGSFLVGAGDGVLPKTMKEMAESLGKGVELKVVDGAGHLPMVEKPDEVASYVAKFLTN
jgi:pimeloyl-ACP methyl ester carboxylesterase